MKTKNINLKAANDVLIEELPKADTINNSDLFVLQKLNGETEATSIQELRNKVLSASESSSVNLGEYVFSSALIENNSLHLMDGSIGYKDQFQEFYAWLLLQTDSVKQFYSLDSVAESFIFPLINNRNLKINSSITNYTGGVAQAMTNHTHKVEGQYNNQFWLTQQSTPPNLTTQRRVLVQLDNSYLGSTTTAKDSTGVNALSTGEQAYIASYMYVRVSSASNILASKSILANGTVSMDLDYIPTDPLDVATKKYIDNKFLNYEIPLSFSINDIGKRIPYYKNAENNPTLIALDGTKYLISDYPDFDSTTFEGFSNDGTYFWYENINLELMHSINNDINSEEYKLLPYFNDFSKGTDLVGDWSFNSKLIYNFLMSPKGASWLVADGTNVYKNNEGFTILNADTFLIRKNYQSYIDVNDIPSGNKIYNFKQGNQRVINGSNYKSLNGGTFVYLGIGGGGSGGEPTYLKIKPDYMVARIQQLGSATGGGDLKSDRSVLLIGTGEFNTKQITSMDDLKSENIIVGGSARVLITLDTKLNEVDTNISTINNNIGSVNITNLQTQVDTNTSDIASIKTVNTNQDTSIVDLQNQIISLQNIITNLQNRVSEVIIQIPILPTTINDGTTANLLLGTPTLLLGNGAVGDYVSVNNNIFKILLTETRRLTFSVGNLATYSTSGTTRSYKLLFRRPAVVNAPGTTANDILNENTDTKTYSNDSIADGEFTFATTFSRGTTDPFYIDGLVVSIDNRSGSAITTLTNRSGYAKASYIRISIG